MIEINEDYCKTIIARWQKLTGDTNVVEERIKYE